MDQYRAMVQSMAITVLNRILGKLSVRRKYIISPENRGMNTKLRTGLNDYGQLLFGIIVRGVGNKSMKKLPFFKTVAN